MIAPLYVIEIEVFPWDPECKLSVTPTTPIHPLFCNEERLYFIRRLGGLHQVINEFSLRVTFLFLNLIRFSFLHSQV